MPEAPKTRNLPDDPAHGLRTPPQSIQSEQAVLGGLLIDNTALDSVADLITAEDFCRRDHQIIYEHIVSLIQHGKPADIVTVARASRIRARRRRSPTVSTCSRSSRTRPRPRTSVATRKSCATARCCAR